MRFMWEAHETTALSWESREKISACENLMRVSWEFNASINLQFRVFVRKRPKMLMRISWHSHEILMRKRSNFHVKKKRLTRISWETPEKSHEKLMKARKSHEKTFQFSRENENLVRFSWDLVKSSWDSHENRWQFSFSHENLMRFSWVLMRIFVRGSVLFSWRDYTIELEKPIRRGVFKRCDLSMGLTHNFNGFWTP